jgi:hypothetical protein
MAPVTNLLRELPGAKVERQFTRPEADLDTEKARGEARTGKKLADLNNYYVITLKKGQDMAALIDQLNSMGIVEIAYPEPKAEPAAITPPHVPSDIAPVTPDLSGGQGYLNAAPTGVNAKYAWTKTGGKGAGITVADIEGGWQIGHEDLDIHNADLLSGTNSATPAWREHGTAVLGEIIGTKNGYGISGIANQAKARMVSIFGNSTANAINIAADNLDPGDIMLIELHAPGPASSAECVCNCGQFEFIAMEFWQDNFDAIQAATAKGIVVVEAGGNGSMDLDNAIYSGNFDRSVRDSGAILVGAASSSVPHNPMCWTNFGKRIDSYGWGENVRTTGYSDLFSGGGDPNQSYTNTFSGTSSASPIVVGAAASLQGYVRARTGGYLTPLAMRQVLTGTGTIQGFGGDWGFKHIATLPDLKQAIGHLAGKVDFDSVKAPSLFLNTTALRDTFNGFGAQFRGTGLSNQGGAVLHQDSNFSVSGHSPPNFLAFNCGATLSDGAIPKLPERVIFTGSLFKGLPGRVTLRAGSGASAGENVTFTAKGLLGNVLHTAPLTLTPELQSVNLKGAGIRSVSIAGPAACQTVVDDVYFGGSLTRKYTDNFGIDYYLTESSTGKISGRTENTSFDGTPWIVKGSRAGSVVSFKVTNPALDQGCFAYTFKGAIGANGNTMSGNWSNNDGVCTGSGTMSFNATGVAKPAATGEAASSPMSGGM